MHLPSRGRGVIKRYLSVEVIKIASLPAGETVIDLRFWNS